MSGAKLILASQSPRRRQLLTQIGVDFEVMPADLDERLLPGETAEEHVRRLAAEKARVVFKSPAVGGRRLVLAADTVVIIHGEILGKPTGRADGIAMLNRLSGQRHTVLTALHLIGPDGRERSALNRSEVDFREFAPGEAEAYWETGEPADKAGAYGVQGLGATFIESIHGSYTGIMGLPLHDVSILLSDYGIEPFATHSHSTIENKDP
ncbi:MAG: septum formation inhibitor Maf [Gammaproteobacteria bacterium]|nr:septum formation inhibitor Maf [Gammaproteobacteria bacterium]